MRREERLKRSAELPENARRLQEWMDRRGMKPSELARRLSVDRSWVHRSLSGERRITASELARMADVLEAPRGALVGEGVTDDIEHRIEEMLRYLDELPEQQRRLALDLLVSAIRFLKNGTHGVDDGSE